MHEPTISLTQKEIAFFRENGFLALDSLTTVEEVAWLIDVYDRLFAEKAGFEEGNQYDLAGTDAEDQAPSLPQLVNPINYAPELGDILLKVNARVVAEQLLWAPTWSCRVSSPS